MVRSEHRNRGVRRCPRGGILGLGAALVVLCFATVASATVVEFASLADLVEFSDLAVRGEVVDKKVFYDDTADRIVTHTTIEVDETYMGRVAGRVRVEQWGGTYRGETRRIPGDADFEVGREVVVFLRRDDDQPGDEVFLTALAQSKYDVQHDDERALVSRDLSDLVFTDATSERLFRVEGRVESLESFEARLRSLVYARKGGEQ